MTTNKNATRDAMNPMVGHEARDRGVSNLSGNLEGPARKEQERSHLRALLLDGANSKGLAAAEGAYFAGLGEHIAPLSDSAS